MQIKRMSLLSIVISAIMLFTACSDKSQTIGENGTNKFTYWVPLNTNAAMTVSNYGETPFAKELQKRLGVEIEYQHPPQGNAIERFNIMISMGDLPDIIEYSWMQYPGGPAKAIHDGIIQKLDLKKNAPNLYSYSVGRPEVDKLMKTDQGDYFAFPFIRGDRMLQTSAGPVIRHDWLKELNMDIPETIDDWEKVLTAFKEKKNAKSPLSISEGHIAGWGLFVGAFGIADGLYIDNGVVKYGALETEYKDFLTLMNKWYQKGLLAADFASIDPQTIDSNIINGFSGATAGSIGSGIGRWMSAAREEGFLLAATPYPVINRGDKPEFGQMQLPLPGTFAAISKNCENIEAAMKFLDYGYSEEGRMMYNFGIEGTSYVKKEGYPTYTELIMKNSEGLSVTASMARYLQAYSEGPFIQDKRYMEQYATLPQQKEAYEIWSDTNMEDHIMPHISLDPKESEVMARNISSINTYKSEMLIKFIMGLEPVSNYDKFVSELRARGIVEY